MRIVRVHSLFPHYLEQFYRKHADLRMQPYQTQLERIMQDGFSWGDAFTYYMNKQGYESFDVVKNAPILLESWRRERGSQSLGFELEVEVIASLKPELLFLTNIQYSPDQIRSIRDRIPSIRAVLGWHCAPIRKEHIRSMRELDAIVTCTPGFHSTYVGMGMKSYQMNHGADPRIWERIQNHARPTNDIVFSGSFVTGPGFHYERLKTLKSLLDLGLKLDIYAPTEMETSVLFLKRRAAEILRSLKHFAKFSKVIRDWVQISEMHGILEEIEGTFHPPKYGMEMFELLASARVSLNFQTNSVDRFSGNLRMFEATAMGSALLTDHKDGLADFFKIDDEITTFRSSEECVEKARWMLAHPEQTKAMAKRGQNRCLSQHSIEGRVEGFRRWVTSWLGR